MKAPILTGILSALLLIGCTERPRKQADAITPQYSVRVFQSELDQFGYDINRASATIIHQPTVPGVSGTRGFASKQDAEKVAAFVVTKLNHNISPPSVTTRELDSLHIKRGN